ncbi:glycosyltransferase family 2 protein [Marivirga harenae]|uniref:glycosyltransferase family 2 protein n=1 Tax=Marivirga harenae TaxID=2010992 RepID=UPI0026E036F8|nr:glycosyltransferase [Marivirga harenae]WKV13427.1 glycosyltransferase [Marivirga harenae]
MSTVKPLVSIIMPAYNAEEYIHQAIESIVNQTYDHWELLICDDGSTDKTCKVISDFSDKRIQLVAKTKNTGAFISKNLLISKANGSYITFLDADDIMSPSRIELQLKAFSRNAKLGMVGCQMGYINKNGRIIRHSNRPLNYEDIIKDIYSNNVIGGSTMFIKKSVLDDIGGGFRSYFKRLSYQDYDLSILIAEKYPCYNLPDFLYYYRQHDTSISKVCDPDRLLAKDLVIYLAKQRRERGTDDLMEGKSQLVDQYLNELRLPYIEDPSKIYRQFAADYMYAELYVKAIKTSWHSIIKRPYLVKNWRTFFYCVRMSIYFTFTISKRVPNEYIVYSRSEFDS